jgi:hypothetical protein
MDYGLVFQKQRNLKIQSFNRLRSSFASLKSGCTPAPDSKLGETDGKSTQVTSETSGEQCL